MLRLTVAALLAAVSIPVTAAEPPRRVASTNLCLDELAWRIAAPGQLVAVSSVAHDASLSSIAGDVAGLPGIDLRGEALLALKADLVLADSYAGSTVKSLLRRQGVSVAEIAMATDLDAAATQAERIGAAMGRAEQGRALAEALRHDATTIAGEVQRTLPAERPLAALWQANGGTQGRGSLPDDLLQRAGLRNLASELGIGGFGLLSIETLIQRRPRLLILDASATVRSRAEALQFHPALRHAGIIEGVIGVPRRALVCAGPQSLEALRRLVIARTGLASSNSQILPVNFADMFARGQP